MKYVPKVQSRSFLISVKELYRPIPYKKPRKARRKRRRHARWLAAMSPEERALYFFLKEEMRKTYFEEVDRIILWGNGSPL